LRTDSTVERTFDIASDVNYASQVDNTEVGERCFLSVVCSHQRREDVADGLHEPGDDKIEAASGNGITSPALDLSIWCAAAERTIQQFWRLWRPAFLPAGRSKAVRSQFSLHPTFQTNSPDLVYGWRTKCAM
jgi:hypothetical protein